MSANTSIQWTDATWNPTRGCSRVSPGCDNCYAKDFAHRFSGPGKPYDGLTTIRRGKVDWTGVARFIPSALAEPLSWRKPQRIFVNSMSDLFHESLSNEEIAAVFGVMAACPQHTFQVLTKRPLRARDWFYWLLNHCVSEDDVGPHGVLRYFARKYCKIAGPTELNGNHGPWPLPNVHLGVSVENQPTADARIPEILRCPAALYFVSAEPLLEPLDISKYLKLGSICECPSSAKKSERCEGKGPAGWIRCNAGLRVVRWVIAGFESGHGARAGNVRWIEELVRQCVSVTGGGKKPDPCPMFVKQMGSNFFAPWKVRWVERHDGSFDAFSTDGVGTKGTNFATVWRGGVWHTWDRNGTGGENAAEATVDRAKRTVIESLQRQHAHPIKGWAQHSHMLKDRKGGEMEEWPEPLRVREFPKEVSRG